MPMPTTPWSEIEHLEDYVTVRVAAVTCGVSESRIRQLIRAGRLPARRAGERILVVRLADVQAFAAAPRRIGTAGQRAFGGSAWSVFTDQPVTPARRLSSPLVGVSLHPHTGKWQATARRYGRQYYLGLHVTQEQAAEAVDAFHREHASDTTAEPAHAE